MHFWQFLGIFFWFFSKVVLCRGLQFFALQSVSQNALFELSKTTFGTILKIFIIRGVPHSQKLTGVEKKGNKNLKKKSNKGEKWNKIMGGRSCFVTRGAFGHGLPHKQWQTNNYIVCIQVFLLDWWDWLKIWR